MKILQIISSLDSKYGGPPLSVYLLSKGLIQKGVNNTLLTFAPSKINVNNIFNEKFIKTLRVSNYARFSYSNEIARYLNHNFDFDIFHGHGLWQYPNHKIASFARSKNKLYILSTRGMLNKEAMNQSKWLKKFIYTLFQKKDLEKASALHATSHQEMEHIRSMGLRNPIAVIPNPIDFSENNRSLYNKTGKRIGYIGRFEKIKNIENLIEAWARVGKNLPDWELVLIGDGAKEYVIGLKNLAIKLGVKNIQFEGFLSGQEKNDVLNSFTYLVLPSKSENFGMVVPEALIRGIPVIASKGTPWEILNNNNAGWWIDLGVEPLVNTLNAAMKLTESERQQMGTNGRKLVEENYTIEIVANKMIQLYEWILYNKAKPEFVYV